MRSDVGPLSITRSASGLRRRHHVKSIGGRGRKREAWVEALCAELVENFHQVRRAGLKVTLAVLLEMARMNIRKAPTGSLLHISAIDPASKRLISSHLDTNWIQRFCVTKNIVGQRQTGKLMVSPQSS